MTDPKCNPVHPQLEKVFMTLSVSGSGNQIAITVIYQACKESRSRTYRVTAEDDETFILPDDLHRATLRMLDGVSAAIMRLARHGYDREP